MAAAQGAWIGRSSSRRKSVFSRPYRALEGSRAPGVDRPVHSTSQPTLVLATHRKLWINGDLMRHVLSTTLEATAGFLFGTVFRHGHRRAALELEFSVRVLEPYLVCSTRCRKIALGPIFVVWPRRGDDVHRRHRAVDIPDCHGA
jgi:hypothetical protein